MKTDVTAVLTTVNAPYGEKLDGATLAHCLTHPAAARRKAGHMSSFFAEVPPEAQMAFADAYGIPATALVEAAKAFAGYSGETYPLAS